MCRTLLHELGREQPKTTKELLDITTRHAFGEEVVEAAFILGNVGAVANGGQATPTKATVKSARKGGKAEKGAEELTRCVAIVASNGNGDEGADNSGEEFIAAVEHDFK
jgi:hypothetical protein